MHLMGCQAAYARGGHARGEHKSVALCTLTAGRLGSPDFWRLEFEKTLMDEINQQVLPRDLAKYSPGISSPPMSRRHSQHAEKVSSRDGGVRGLKGADVEPRKATGERAMGMTHT